MYARQFVDAFCNAYRECRALFNATTWASVWDTDSLKKGSLNHFMLWSPPPLPQPTPVLYLTARKMNLEACAGEPLHLDAAFYPQGGSMVQRCPLPILVAVEHENRINGFRDELNKLAHVRCRLKVGVTYTEVNRLPTHARLGECKAKIKRELADILDTHSKHTTEDAGVEYLIILGHESSRRHLEWHAWSFAVGDGLQSSGWRRICD
jgi:hypothetical protein